MPPMLWKWKTEQEKRERRQSFVTAKSSSRPRHMAGRVAGLQLSQASVFLGDRLDTSQPA
jgi:hypothetical protein